MSRKILLLLLWFIVAQQPVFAKVVISEFQIEPTNDQWVELFNDASEAADLAGWILDDSGGSEKFIMEESIEALSFKVFRSGKFNLNKSEDSLQLFDNVNTLLESFSYNQSPGENISWGKTAENFWGICQPTPGDANNCYVPSPTPTPTFTPSPTPVPTATLKPSPSATFSPTPKITVTNTKTPTTMEKPEITNSVSPTAVNSLEAPETDFPLPENLLALEDGLILGEASPSSNSTRERDGKILPDAPADQDNQPNAKTLFWLMVLTGGLFIAGSIVLFYTAQVK
ncbi:lamin tail domain-containing protein [Candidatus Microgenomates bacterium]|nr:lamin tail domain-containing protein [Candidatus Microgenomates bacterium]